MRYAPPNTALPPHIPPHHTVIPPVLHSPPSPSIWTKYFVHHCQFFVTHDPHHTLPFFAHTTRTCFPYVCLPPPSSFLCFFGCDLLACMVHLIFSFLCKISLSLSLRPSPSLFLSPLSIPLFLSLSLPVALSRSLAIFV